ncbi:uncharacterized protein T551_02616 [Pneumocystis jirovecii RU7]|uniref:Uncharacterized protein n=1 Tax=Pneumocystis jirovecii (strain RU7) TaxID=1408657 RepID=A0A0W4ZIK1_PNEJ7|nr:uncharacterized protein T551_02616 [Pneumocystis jirovecii RU7]KTW28197.1 hypothetical protein T551_02616 [Pneumocystis jirovecii RU7]
MDDDKSLIVYQNNLEKSIALLRDYIDAKYSVNNVNMRVSLCMEIVLLGNNCLDIFSMLTEDNVSEVLENFVKICLTRYELERSDVITISIDLLTIIVKKWLITEKLSSLRKVFGKIFEWILKGVRIIVFLKLAKAIVRDSDLKILYSAVMVEFMFEIYTLVEYSKVYFDIVNQLEISEGKFEKIVLKVAFCNLIELGKLESISYFVLNAHRSQIIRSW